MIEPLRDLSKLNTAEKLSALENYIRELCEHLNWQLHNLDKSNFNEEETNG